MTLTVRPDDLTGPSGRCPRVVLIDDHQLLAQSLALALQLEGVSCDVAELGDRDSLLHFVLSLAPDLVLLDLDLGDGLSDGVSLATPLTAAGCRVLVVSASTDHDQICRALDAGAIGALSKSAPFRELLDAVLVAARGEDPMPPVQRRRIVNEARRCRSARERLFAPFERLSTREAQVLRALGDGVGVSAIANAWCVSEETVRSQVKAIRTKLGVGSQLEAVAMARRCGWLDSHETDR